MDHLTFLDKNGLVEGLIPVGIDCPFKNECEIAKGDICKRPFCMNKNFSCAFARGFSICKEMKKIGKNIKYPSSITIEVKPIVKKLVVCRKKHLCGRAENFCGHLFPHKKNEHDMMCCISYCGVIGKNTSCVSIKEKK